MNLNRSFRTYQKVKLDPCGQKGLPRTVSPRPAKAVRGMTLVETLMAVAVGSLVLGVIAVASMTASFWFASLTNYVDMDVKSRNALDQMTLKIRQAGALTEFSPTHLKFVARTRPMSSWSTIGTRRPARSCNGRLGIRSPTPC